MGKILRCLQVLPRVENTQSVPLGHLGRSIKAEKTLRALPGTQGHFQRSAAHRAERRKHGSQCSRVWEELLRSGLSHDAVFFFL